MKKIVLLLFACLVLIMKPVEAQTPNWGWAEASTGGIYQNGVGISANTSGKIFINGRTTGTSIIGGLTITTTGSNPCVGELDSTGIAVWLTVGTHSNGLDYPYGFARDARNNTYSIGDLNSGSGGMFFDKHDGNGNLLWSVVAGASSAAGYAITADNSGNVYITGEYNGTLTLGTTTITSTSASNDIFVAKCDSNGNFKWVETAGGTGYDGGRGIAVDNFGNVYVCGAYSQSTGPVSFGSISAPNANAGYPSFFIAKYDAQGNAVWVNTATNAGFGTSTQFWSYNGLAIDSCSNLYVTGHFVNTAQFGSLSVTSAGKEDIFVAKCLNNGNWEWVKSAGGTTSDEGESIALDRYSDIYVTGYFEDTANFGAKTVTATGSVDLFAAKYSNSTGDVQWVQTTGGAGVSTAQGVSVDNSGNVYLTGEIQNSVSFGATTISAASTGNIFIAKLDTVPKRVIIPVVGKSYCPGSTQFLSYTTIGIFNNGNVFTAQLSDSSGSFANPVVIGDTSSTANGAIKITIPSNTVPGADYLIRVVSSSPATSSWANGCGTYYNNIYPNDFYVTIGSGLNISVSISPNDTICKGASVTLIASGGGTYLWNTGSTSNSITASPVEDTTYSVYVSNGGCAADDSIKIHVSPNSAPSVIISPATADICIGDNVGFIVSGATTYSWTPSTGLSSTTGSSVTANPNSTTTYNVIGSASGCSNSDTVVVTVDSCNYVWPGDANDDLTVDNYDLIPIGLYYNETGPSRDTITATWGPHKSVNWGSTQFNGYNKKFVDCNGDGVISSNDTLVIKLNCGKTHLHHAPRGSFVRTSGMPLYFVADSLSYHAGSKVHVAVWLGTASQQLKNIYAMGYDIGLDTSLLQHGTLGFAYNNSYLGTKNTDALAFTHMSYEVETAVARTDHHGKSGYGKIGDLYFILSPTISTPQYVVSFLSNEAVDSVGNAINLQATDDTLSIIPTGINKLSGVNNKVSIYPNPGTGLFTLSSSKIINEVKVTNVLGQVMYDLHPNESKFNLTVKEDGMYFITTYCTNEIITQKIIVAK